MRVRQLSIELENVPGRIAAVCRSLADAGINLLVSIVTWRGQVGTQYIVVRDWQQAKTVLKHAGYTVRVHEVLAAEIPDRPGGVLEVLGVLEDASINVGNMYCFSERLNDRAIVIFEFDEINTAANTLREAQIAVLSNEELYRRLANTSVGAL